MIQNFWKNDPKLTISFYRLLSNDYVQCFCKLLIPMVPLQPFLNEWMEPMLLPNLVEMTKEMKILFEWRKVILCFITFVRYLLFFNLTPFSFKIKLNSIELKLKSKTEMIWNLDWIWFWRKCQFICQKDWFLQDWTEKPNFLVNKIMKRTDERERKF